MDDPLQKLELFNLISEAEACHQEPALVFVGQNTNVSSAQKSNFTARIMSSLNPTRWPTQLRPSGKI